MPAFAPPLKPASAAAGALVVLERASVLDVAGELDKVAAFEVAVLGEPVDEAAADEVGEEVVAAEDEAASVEVG